MRALLLPVALGAVSSVLTCPDANEEVMPVTGLAKSSDRCVMASAGARSPEITLPGQQPYRGIAAWDLGQTWGH